MSILRFTMENPPQGLRYGEDLQKFRTRVRSSSGPGTLRIDLYDGSTFIEELINQTVDSPGVVLEAPWSAESLVDRTGRSVEILVTATGVDVGSFAWYPEMILAPAGARTVLVPTLIRAEKRAETRIITVPSSRERTVNIPRRRV